MTKTEFINLVNQHVEYQIAEGMSAIGTDEFIEADILDELVKHDAILPESTSKMLCGLLVVIGMRRREILGANPTH